MEPSQIVLYSIIAIVAFIYLRKFIMSKSLKHYTPAELSGLLQQHSDIILLDVRTKSEHQQNHIKGSLHIPLNELSNRLKELERYKQQEIVCYCLSGSRSLVAAAKLQHQGFNTANLRGGMAEWNFHHR
ncbi:MAG: rhodanese-like domain-containing protein [Bacteroidetes bacterium]|nr:MAG: rhodanese-like domain-containing protein [Bacteroidota bacterium]